MDNEYLQPLWDAFASYADYPAIIDAGGTRTTSYREYATLVKRVITWLRGRDIPEHSFIPILMPQSLEYVVAEIGIWMAGHTAVPMGMAFPEDRIAYIREHCEAPLIFDGAAWHDAMEAAPADEPSFPPPKTPAVLIYTSGSTGTPKGIVHTFEGLATKHTEKQGIVYSPKDVWGMGAPLYFVAGLSIFKVLKEGAQLHLYDSETYRDIRKLEDYIVEHGVTTTFLSPAMLSNFHNRSDSLKVVFTGSERLTGQCSRDGYKLANCYGMSETGGTVAAFFVSHPYDTTPVGQPEDSWCLLDDDGNEVLPGEEGELCLRGKYCEGYYKDPESTAELYRGGWLHTGDLLRQLPGGDLVYVNRKDWMAKINGQRVEPGEVENAIRELDGVENAVVKAFDGDTGSQYLCAFYIGDVDAETLRDELSETLPPYMVPSYFLAVREFALLPNGKINRKVLMAPDVSELRSDYVPPATPTERTLCDAFAELFGLEQVGAKDDFFLLGGDSVKVMKLQQLCEGLDLSTKMIYKQRTPRAIALAVEEEAALAIDDAQETSGPVPLTQTQLGIYVESMARAGEAVYNNPVLLRLDPGVDEQRLASAVEAAIEAHPFIKLHVEEDEDGVPVMVPPSDSARQAAAVIVESLGEAQFAVLKDKLIEPFDLHTGPLYRFRIMRTPHNLYFFSDFHHMIYDGTSMRIFMADVERSYAGDELNPETYTGFDVARGEARARATSAYDEAKAYYESQFGNIDLDSKPMPDRAGEAVEFAEHDETIAVAIADYERFCRRLGVTPNIMAIAAFGKVLGAYTNTAEALFATIYNGRADIKCARTVDMMVKTLPVHCRWNRDVRTSDYIHSVKHQILESMAHDIYSFAEVATICPVTSDVLFAYQGDYLALGTVCGLPFERVPLKGNATGSALDFQVFASPDGLVLHVEYQANQYSADFVANMARTYANVLTSMMEEEYLADVKLLDADQSARLDTFNETEAPYDATQTVVSLARVAAAAYPHNVAAVFEDREMSYAELDEMSDRMAALIAERGLGQGDVVSILIPRGLWMPVASLGALKAGCAYQPLDATYPPERLNFMIKDAGAKLLLTTPDLRPLVADYQGDTIELAEHPSLASMPECEGGVPNVAVSPNDLFILLYTSGTTGLPKGVRLTHGNLVCFINWYRSYYNLDSTCRVGAYASFGFDACMMDMYPALCSGAACVIVPEEMRLDLIAMAKYFELNHVSHAFITTQVGRQFAIDAQCATLRHLSMGGETLVPFDVPENPSLYNCYGPTECTIFSTIHKLVPGEAQFPIGAVLPNMKGYVVSPDGKRLPVGACGELWLAGPQIGDGYLNRPEQTAKAFGKNPFGDGAHENLYRTGDVVRYRPDGEIEFIGRRDLQVKIRGFRIELSEVEAVVREFPGVLDATVAAFDHPSGGKYIAAYVVSDEPINVAALGEFIRERKPPYMVPAATVQLERIPLNQNGKVNRRLLPEPDLSSTADGDLGDLGRPLNALEQELCDIAAAVVGIDEVGITTPLVRYGLTSILSIKLLTLIYKRFGVQIRAKDLDDEVSISTLENMILAQWMSGAVKPAPASPMTADADKSMPFRAPLTFAQMGVYYECLKHPKSTAYNIPALFSFDSTVTASDLERAVKAVVAAHPTLTARFDVQGEMVALVDSQQEVPIARLSFDKVELEAFKQSFVEPFDLETGPLCRFAIVQANDAVMLFADFHHLAFDGASMGVFVSALGDALSGKQVEREQYTYAHFAADERTFEQSPDYKENERYYEDLLSDFESATELSADLKGRESKGHQQIVCAPFNFEAVESYSKAKGVTPAAVMLAATSYALSRYVNSRSIYLSTISNGRSDVRTSDTIGMFVNTLPLAVSVGDKSVEAFIGHCASRFAAAIEHERYPFARIAADYGFAPQVVFEYQIGAVGDAALPGLKSVEGLEGDEAKFKVSVHIEQIDGKPQVAIYYNDALYTRERIAGVARSIVVALDHMLQDASAPIRHVSLIDDQRRVQLESFHEVQTGPAAFTLYHEGLEAVAAQHPDDTAIIAADGTFTFAQMNALANRIAHALIRRGVEPRSRVALLLPRTSRVLIAMFGVMKAGCAYIPCDPTYPEERVNHILSDSHAACIITTSDRVATYEHAIDVESLLADASQENDNPCVAITPEDLAYLIYTSGSTGKPKGVMLTHRGVCNFHTNAPANTLVDALVSDAHAFLSVTTLSFDMSIKEVGTPLVNGLTVVLADEDQVNDPGKLAELIAQTGADAFNATHSRLKQYLELPAFAKALTHCKVVLSGGEKYSEGLLPQLQKTGARVFNTYGPTETTVSSNIKELTHENRISVGRPQYNVYECIVDADDNELPADVVGELLIGGAGVAKGYNGLAEKSAEVFIERDGRAMYRSGDYARWLENGDVEILGRTDNQIKLRGLRIEIGEIESTIAAVEGVTNVLVKIAQIHGTEHLCAYFTASRTIDIGELRDEISLTLTKYMVPTAYLQLDTFPLTPNGKTDFKALPAAELYRTAEMVAAANEVEQTFCDIFGNILGLDDVGATDSFFEIGGTSLMAIRVTVEAANAGHQITYGDVFANPTPRDLALLCGAAQSASNEGTAAELDYDAEIEDFDYSGIEDVLKTNNLHSFMEGSRRPLGNMLITGAVGYLGIHILHEYLEHYDGIAYCLLRGRGEIPAAHRLRMQLFYYFENSYADMFGKRIIVIEGDVTKPLPLSEEEALNIDTVVNCAAIVKHFSAGTEIEDVNVGGVRNLVSFCLERGVPLIQISTGSTVKCMLKPGKSVMGKVDERQLYLGQDLVNKYVRSKFLAERLVLDAIAHRGLSAKIMRVGNLAPRTYDGEFQINFETNSAMGRLRSFAMLGCAPYDQLDATMEFSPINEVACAILKLAQTPDACVLFHPFNHHETLMGDVFDEMTNCGLEVMTVEREAFVDALRAAEEDPDKARILTSMLAYVGKPAGGKPRVVPKAGNAYTMQVLYRLGFRWTAPSQSYIAQFLEGLESLGFFDL
ncbi:MAG: amino acid adenylation domain-containing protein [Coriobacteriales bacterium]|nr:amino acid adenylation domain-containing protein [Coriobacteriales bacterium]